MIAERLGERCGVSLEEGRSRQDCAPGKRKKRRGGITPAGRRRLSQAIKKRWVEQRAFPMGCRIDAESTI